MRVLGVDGCRGGWLAAALDGSSVDWRWVASFADLVTEPAAVIAVDIPIGLASSGPRACDVSARRALGRRGPCVFPAPARPVLACSSYAEARAMLAGLRLPSMSAQAFGIVRAVRDVDCVVTPADEPRVIEVHPEVAFAAMTGWALPGKRTAAGVAARVDALRSWLPSLDAVLAEVPPVARGRDDPLDALACAWVARRWALGRTTVYGDGARDSRGLLMRIVA